MMDDDDYKVGYRKPPRHTQFKKGQSGNPAGRKPKSKNFDVLMERALDAKIKVKIAGNEQLMSKREAIPLRLVQDALEGNLRSLESLFKYLREQKTIEPFEVTADDDKELELALERMRAKEGNRSDDK
jgi:hypothetical protein